MLQDLLNLNVFAFFLILARISAGLMVLPGYSAGWVSPRIRLMLAFGTTFILTPVLMDSLPVIPNNSPDLIILIIGEVIIGLMFGFIGRILMGALQTAGTIIAMVSSLANAMVQDPIAQQQSSVLAGMLIGTGLVLLFVTNMHHLMLVALIDSYSLFKPGVSLPVGDFANMMARKVADSFALGLQLAAPFVITAMIYYIGLGVLGRLMPQLQVFFVGMPLQISLQFWVLVVTISGIMIVFMRHFEDSFMSLLAL